MWIFIGSTAPSKIFVWDTEVSKVFVWDTQVRPTWPDKDYLCFTANTAGSTVQLNKVWSPTAVTLETSTNWTIWSTYTIWDAITLTNIWDKVYFRNTSTTDTSFGTSYNDYYYFYMSWSVAWSWDINFFLNKNSTLTISSNYCFYKLFIGCSSLTSCPSLPATTLTTWCYDEMFRNCTSLATLPSLPALNIPDRAYYRMFENCSSIKLSTTQTGEYQTAYRIPTSWTWSVGSYSTTYMFDGTWWTWTRWQPTIGETYYTSNTVV